MGRKLWLLLILSLFIVGRESCCASQGQNIGLCEQLQRVIDSGQKFVESHKILLFTIGVPCTFLWYWYFDLHQKEEGWYTCKFYYAAGYRTKLFYNRIYLDFYYSLFRPDLFFFVVNINVRIYHDFYIFLPIPVLPILLSVVIMIASLLTQ